MEGRGALFEGDFAFGVFQNLQTEDLPSADPWGTKLVRCWAIRKNTCNYLK